MGIKLQNFTPKYQPCIPLLLKNIQSRLSEKHRKIINPFDRYIEMVLGIQRHSNFSIRKLPVTSISVEPLARKIAIDSIAAYQTYISPRKGFACAHRMLHGGDSCSMYIKRLLGEESLMSAVQMSHQRFKACVAASHTLKATKSTSGCIIIPCCLPI